MTRLAIRLLQLVRGGDDPLVGDLLEEHARKPSSLWLWKQVVVAIAATAWTHMTGRARRASGAGQRPSVDFLRGAVLTTVAVLSALGLLISREYLWFAFAFVSLAGGASMALVRFVLQARHEHDALVSDAFARDGLGTAPLNLAQVRVAGPGGAGLVFVVICIAVEIHAIGIAMIAALLGGALLGTVLVLHRTHHHPAAPTTLTR